MGSKLFVRRCTSIIRLNLRNNSLGPDAGPVIGCMLKYSRTLRHIDLSWNEIGSVGGKSLLRGLQTNFVVVELNLNGTRIGEDTLHGVDLKLKENNLKLPHGSPDSPLVATKSTLGVATSTAESPIASPPATHTSPQMLSTTLGMSGPVVDTIPTTRDHFPLSSGARLVHDEDVAHHMLTKERSCTCAEDANLLTEATDHIHALQLDIDHQKKQRVHTEEKEQSTKKAFADREMRYTRHVRELEQTNAKVQMDKDRLAAESLHLHGEIERKQNEKYQTQQDMIRMQDAARITADRLRSEVRNALQKKADLQAKLTSVKSSQAQERDENAKLRAHINECKDDIGLALG